MKHLVYILLGLMLVGVFSCRRSPGGTEARLVAIDSLITAKPDSALALLADINADSLPADLRAYHDLLTTQALYKAYIPATTDTLIARAWSYYRDHGPYDRRIRALLYSGTTAEELGRPDSAMHWYKRTELESRPDDHYHRAYALESMGMLYQNVYQTRNSIDKYKQALSEFYVLGDTINTLFCGLRLCQMYSKFNLDSALFYGKNVQAIAITSNRIEYATSVTQIIGKRLFYDQKYTEAKDLTLKAVAQLNRVPFDAWCCLALCYLHLNQIDSAQYYFDKAETPTNVSDSILYYQFKSIKCKLNNDIDNSIKFDQLSNEIAAEEMVKSKENQYQQIEFNENDSYNNNIHNNKISIIAIILVIVLTVFLLYVFVIRKRKNELEQELDQLQAFTDHLQAINDNLNSKYKEAIKQSVSSEMPRQNLYTDAYNNSLDISRYYEIISAMSESFRFLITQIRKNIKTEKKLKELDETIRQTLTPHYFDQLRAFVNFAYSDLALQMEKSGLLMDKEINVICMYLCRIPNTITRIYLKFSNTQNTIRYRNNVAKKYFGQKEVLDSMLENMHL